MNHKDYLCTAGVTRMLQFCEKNGLEPPEHHSFDKSQWGVAACGYYREFAINVCPALCAAPGHAGRAWSWPAYVIDRTPYGVVAHELGHHADFIKAINARGKYYSDFSVEMRKRTGEPPITGYCENDAEWFAEIFRLYVTNPALLKLLRPKTYAAIQEHFQPVGAEVWEGELENWNAPGRIIDQARKKIAAMH